MLNCLNSLIEFQMDKYPKSIKQSNINAFINKYKRLYNYITYLQGQNDKYFQSYSKSIDGSNDRLLASSDPSPVT